MSRSSKLLCVFYAVVAVAALYGTWSENLLYGPNMSTQFLADLRVNPASRSISIDVFLVALSAAVWMVFEARRIGLRLPWVYVLLGFLVAISMAFPLYLLAREVRLASLAPVRPASRAVVVLDYAGLGLVTVLIGWLAVWLH